MNLGLMSLPVRDVPHVHKAIAEGLNIQPTAMSVALLMRSLGKLNRVTNAEAIWQDSQVILTVVAMHTNSSYDSNADQTETPIDRSTGEFD